MKDNIEADLSSDAANKVQDDLRELGLPTLDSLKNEFHQLANQLGGAAGSVVGESLCFHQGYSLLTKNQIQFRT